MISITMKQEGNRLIRSNLERVFHPNQIRPSIQLLIHLSPRPRLTKFDEGLIWHVPRKTHRKFFRPTER